MESQPFCARAGAGRRPSKRGGHFRYTFADEEVEQSAKVRSEVRRRMRHRKGLLLKCSCSLQYTHTHRLLVCNRKGVLDVGMSGLKDITAGAVGGLKKLRRGGSSDDGVDPRTRKANETFKRMFKMMDYNHDHSLRIGELRAGLQVLQHAWQQLSKLCKWFSASLITCTSSFMRMLSTLSSCAPLRCDQKARLHCPKSSQ